MIDNSFKLFEVYLGATKRKEDFFTYYLSSCFEYLYKKDSNLFKEILKILKLEEAVDLDSYELITGEGLAHFFQDKTIKAYLNKMESTNYNRSNIKRLVFREFPLPNGKNACYYMDIAFAIRSKEEVYFIVIEGKVTDSSVRSGQLSEYYNCLPNVLINTFNKENIHMKLLSTIEEKSQGIKSKAWKEVEEFKRVHSNLSGNCNLVLWEKFKFLFELFLNDGRIDDAYFKYTYEDAFAQLELNMISDKTKLPISKNLKLYGLDDYINDAEHIEKFEELFEESISITEGKKYQKLEITKFSDVQQDKLIDWIIEIFERADIRKNLKKYDVSKRIQIPQKLKNKYIQQLEFNSDKRQVLEQCVQSIKDYGVDKFPMSIQEIIKTLNNEIHNIKEEQQSDTILSLIKEYIDNLEDDIAKQFYEKLFIQRKFYKNEYVKFVSNTKSARLNKLGVWVMPSKKLKKSEISLMFFENRKGTINITNGK